jgi:dienelactone hydrolase
MNLLTPIKLPIALPKCPWAKNEVITTFPPRVDLGLRITSQRTHDGYEEWRVTFASEPAAGLPDPSLAEVSAYLLIPREARYVAPYPAMVCFHQCGRDCDIGKEAVVGKVVERPDQAYGLELVRQGFVVLAPDSINCGERIIKALRTAGAPPHTWTHANCWAGLWRFVPWGPDRWKKVWDGIRSIDALCTFPFVDQNRIGVIGHSMGSGTALDTLIADPRIKAGILSPGGCSEADRALAAPRLLIQQQAILDTTPEDLQRIPEIQAQCRAAYAAQGVPATLFDQQVVNAGHHFTDEFKVRAFAQLKQHFGMISRIERVTIQPVIEQTLAALERREDLWWSWPNHRPDGKLPAVELTGDSAGTIHTDPVELRLAFETLLVPLTQKIPHGSQLAIAVELQPESVVVTMSVVRGSDAVIVAHESLLRRAAHHVAHCGGSLDRRTTADGLTYTIHFPR